jgi:hypothetical protein
MTHRSVRATDLWRRLVLSVFGLLLVAACTDKQLEPARQAIAEIEAAVTAAGTEPAKYIPNLLGDVTDQLAVLKTRFEQEDYAGVLKDAPAALAAAKALPAEAAARKVELHAMLQQEWDTLAAAVPGEIAAVRRQVERISRTGKLPDGMTVARLDSARAGIDDARALWERAVAGQADGHPEEAVTLATQAREHSRSLAAALGTPPAAAPVK